MNYTVKIKAFSRAMAGQFAINENRGGYRTRDPGVNAAYVEELEQVVARLKKMLVLGEHDRGATSIEHEADILALAADGANLCLILAENANALRFNPKDIEEMENGQVVQDSEHSGQKTGVSERSEGTGGA